MALKIVRELFRLDALAAAMGLSPFGAQYVGMNPLCGDLVWMTGVGGRLTLSVDTDMDEVHAFAHQHATCCEAEIQEASPEDYKSFYDKDKQTPYGTVYFRSPLPKSFDEAFQQLLHLGWVEEEDREEIRRLYQQG